MKNANKSLNKLKLSKLRKFSNLITKTFSQGNSRKRVVVTGIGAVTPLGNSLSETFDNIKLSKCGIKSLIKETHVYRRSQVHPKSC